MSLGSSELLEGEEDEEEEGAEGEEEEEEEGDEYTPIHLSEDLLGSTSPELEDLTTTEGEGGRGW